MRHVRRCTRTGCSQSAVATLTYIYSDSTAVVGPLAAFAEPHSYDLCEEHAVRLTVPRGWEVLRHVGEFPSPIPHADDLEALADAVREAARVEPAGQPRLRRRGRPADRPPRPPAGGAAAGLRLAGDSAGCARLGRLVVRPAPPEPAQHPRRCPPVIDLSEIVKAYDVRGIVGEQLTDEVARALGAAFVTVTGARRLVAAHDMRESGPGLLAAFADGRHQPGCGRRRHRAGLDRHAVLRLRPARPARRDVHRQPQSGPLQRHQAVPGRRPADRLGDRPGRDPRAAPSATGRRPAGRRSTSPARVSEPDAAGRLRPLPARAGRPVR